MEMLRLFSRRDAMHSAVYAASKGWVSL